MEVKVFLIIFIYTIFIINFVFTRALGLSPFWGGVGKISYPLVMGYAVICIMTLSSFATHVVFQYFHILNNTVHLSTMSFMIVIVIFTVCINAIIKKISFPLYQALGFSLPVLMANCVVLGGALAIVNALFIGQHYGMLSSVAYGFGGGAGFTIILVIMTGIQERLELTDMPGYLRGLPILFITMGLLSLASLGFLGIIL
jgi:electron transport complex protein RnfA